ncbi:MAG: 2-5 ligase [Actinomycetia bacterium]|nr:2-5 ligase [Actinomycetes bacterium]
MTRAFVAVVPPPAVLDAVDDAVTTISGSIPPGGRFTSRDQHHLTLQFLGNHADVDAAGAALEPLAVRRGDVRLGGAGAFPSPRHARVLWVGATEGAALLTQLAGAVGALLVPLGFEPESRPYHPHLTLARWKSPTDVRGAVAAMSEQPLGPAWSADAIVVFESRLRREGAQYVARSVVPLAD